MILEDELAERPDDPFVLFNLGSIAVERQDWQSAPGHLQRSLTGSAPTDSIVWKLFALIARCHQMLSDLPAALNTCSEDPRIDPDDAELHLRKSILHRRAKKKWPVTLFGQSSQGGQSQMLPWDLQIPRILFMTIFQATCVPNCSHPRSGETPLS